MSRFKLINLIRYRLRDEKKNLVQQTITSGFWDITIAELQGIGLHLSTLQLSGHEECEVPFLCCSLSLSSHQPHRLFNYLLWFLMCLACVTALIRYYNLQVIYQKSKVPHCLLSILLVPLLCFISFFWLILTPRFRPIPSFGKPLFSPSSKTQALHHFCTIKTHTWSDSLINLCIHKLC